MDPIKLEIQETHLECDFDHLLHIKPEVDIFFVHVSIELFFFSSNFHFIFYQKFIIVGSSHSIHK